MAIYYLNVQIIGRSAGRSATGAAAYRAGERIHDERTGQTYDYTRRRGEIETMIMAPAGAPEWVQDRAQLWNQVEKAERRGDAQLCREFVVAFPKELDQEQQRELIRSYVGEQFISRGMVADVAIHRNPGNPHAHIMLTMREIGPEGLSSKKNRDWNKPEMLEQWREQWAVQANSALERAGREERIDHRSLAEQGSDRLPQVHLGPHGAAMERQGISTEKGEHNRLVAEHNAVVIDLEKAREEERRLEAEKVVGERYKTRLKGGWAVGAAKALAQLEYGLGGDQLTPKQTVKVLEENRSDLRRVESQIRAIHQEGDRLERAAEILQQRQRAADEVQRLKAPLASVRRWFSKDARAEFAQAEERLRFYTDATEKNGTTSDAELHEQRSKWQRDQGKLPILEQKADVLSKTIELASRALEGFRQEHEHEREPDWRMRKKRDRVREAGPDR